MKYRRKRIGQHKDTFHLLLASEETGAAVLISRCCQVRKGVQVFAFRVIPGTKRGEDVNGYADIPVHLPMIATVTPASNHDEPTLIVGDCTGSRSTILKVELRRPACNQVSFAIRMFQCIINFPICAGYQEANLLFTISPVLLESPPTIMIL